MQCKAYLIDYLLTQAGNDKQGEVRLILHLHIRGRFTAWAIVPDVEQYTESRCLTQMLDTIQTQDARSMAKAH